jgi:cholesterol oxidase
MSEQLEVVVIGSGFGGAVLACRSSQRWPGGRVLVIERGRRYPRGSFARTPVEMKDSFWNVDGQRRGASYTHPDQRGVFDVRSFRRMDVVQAAGFGGGSLLYANVILEPPDAVFGDDRWPHTCTRSTMNPYYDTVRTVLGARPVPAPSTPERRIPRMELFEDVAGKLRRTSRKLDIAVFFGPDHDLPLPMGAIATNAYGAEQTSCTYCGECDIGCNVHAKNTLDLNYLYAAEHHHGAEIATESLVELVVPLDASGGDDASQDGSFGFRVQYRRLDDAASTSVFAKRVVVSAGSLGSTELLLRCRDVHKTLPRVGARLGEQYSGNGDFLSLIAGADVPTHPEKGPVITQAIDFNLFDNHDPDRAFILQDAGYPNEYAWYVEGVKPLLLKVRGLGRAIVHTVARMSQGRAGGRVGYRLRDTLGGSITDRSAALLCMGLDRATGRMVLDRNGWVRVRWPQRANRKLYRGIRDAAKSFGHAVGAEIIVSAPNWWLPIRKNITVHSLGGCVLGSSDLDGVVSSDPVHFGQVFGYRGLYVADGSIVPLALGANPSLTIAALAERVAEGITGLRPDASLGVARPVTR